MNKQIIQSNLIDDLKERAKELNCLYEIQELLNDIDKNTNEILSGIIAAIPSGWQYPDICVARLSYNDQKTESENFEETDQVLSSKIKVQNETIGKLEVFYTEERPVCDEGPFLKEERRLIKTIADQISSFFFRKQLKSVFEEKQQAPRETKTEWWIILDMLRKTDPKLLIRISRKMVNYLCWRGIKEAENLYEYFDPDQTDDTNLFKETNYPYKAKSESDSLNITSKIIEISNKYLTEKEIFDNISRWIKEDQSGFLVNILGNMGSTFEEISSVIERFHHLKKQGLELSPIRRLHLKVTLIRRLLNDQPEFVNTAKNYIEIDDFNELINSTISPENSHGKYGGKSSGLFLSNNILQRSHLSDEYTKKIKTPNTWVITSDGLLSFMKYNHLEDIAEQKYKSIENVRKEYPYVSHVFKNASLPPKISKGLSTMLDNFDNVPLVVRSTSLLEDKPNAIFAGKYKSLFISNQGTKNERMEELTNAIAEVYASTFGPDPIEYRLERGLIDYNEEMAVMIQEVVGKKVGKYFFPAFAGVAFSQNNYRWSSRIKQEDGLIRLVPGLGTRAVDRLSDDYPVLIAPGKSNLRANVSTDEIIRYSPKNLDVIDLEERCFKTIKIPDLLKEYGNNYPVINQVVSLISENYLQEIRRIGTDFKKNSFVVTFNSLINNTDFIKQISSTLSVLEAEFGFPVDIEFAHNGEDLYLLQCRKQSHGKIRKPAEIPYDVPDEKILFSAERHITNGTLSNITHVVYVDPQKYNQLSNHDDLISVGKAVGKLNKLLPKRQFILMGPGRWGSRGDIKLGVSVTYSEINNTAMLIEIAKKQKDYVPELSFGTHFFQDLVEANIFYLPLYPDDYGIIFKDDFFTDSQNMLPILLSEYSSLSDVIKVIDISSHTEGCMLNILMNEEAEKALAVISDEAIKVENAGAEPESKEKTFKKPDPDFHWKWRLRATEQIAAKLDGKKFGVKRFFVFGSTKNATAGPGSDIDILIHFTGNDDQQKDLISWLDGWSVSLDYTNYLKTGYKSDGLLDVHIVTDEDIKKRTSFAVKIDAVTDAARLLPIGTEL
ncbi:MAG: nucleotidyltransferase domain-containing protein [Bacteroidales bacterium]|nr:nucleotidyltransferase domain-containing protein [Bacteroidales bacterium]